MADFAQPFNTAFGRLSLLDQIRLKPPALHPSINLLYY